MCALEARVGLEHQDHTYLYSRFIWRLLWKCSTAGAFNENVHSGTVAGSIQSKQAAAAPSGCSKETTLHKPNTLSDRPTFVLGLDLTNWIIAHSSFHNAKQTADKKETQTKSAK